MIYRVSAIPLKIPIVFFTEIELLKFVWNHKRPWIIKAILRKKNKAIDITLPDFKLYYKAIVIKIVQYWHKNRHTDLWNRIESSKINPCIYIQLIYKKWAKIIQWGKDNGLKDLNVKPETTKLIEKNPGGKLLDMSLGDDLLDLTSKAKATKAKINKWVYIKLKSSAQQRKPSTKWKCNPTTERKYL